MVLPAAHRVEVYGYRATRATVSRGPRVRAPPETQSVPFAPVYHIISYFDSLSCTFLAPKYTTPPSIPPSVLYTMSETWNVPSRSNSCSISMLTEKISPSFVLFQTTFSFISKVHITIPVNGIIRITFSMQSVVNCLSPFTVSQMPQPPITSDRGFIHKSRFNSVRNRIIEVTKTSKNNFLKKEDTLNAVNHVWIAAFQPFPASDG